MKLMKAIRGFKTTELAWTVTPTTVTFATQSRAPKPRCYVALLPSMTDRYVFAASPDAEVPKLRLVLSTPLPFAMRTSTLRNLANAEYRSLPRAMP